MPPASLLSFPAAKTVEFSVLELARPGLARISIGVFLFDAASRELTFRLRDDWNDLALDEDDLEYVACLAEDFDLRLRETDGDAFLLGLEDSLSNFLTISAREPAHGASLDEIYERHVDGRVRRFETHLPVYSLRAAATRFGEDMEVEAEAAEWRRVPGLRLREGMFIAQVVGRSMEPLIADGSFCVFRAPVVGSRQGKHLLIEVFGATDSSARFTVKRYTSEKRALAGDEWEHARIRLEPLNPEFPAFDLEEGQFRVVGEFVTVLP